MSGALPNASRQRRRADTLAAAGSQQRQHLVVGSARTVGADRLDADMVGAGVPMLLDALADRRLIAPGDIGVDKAVGAAAGEIIVAKAEPAPVVDVIVEPQVVGKRLAGEGTRLRRIAFEQHPDLGAQQFAAAEDMPRLGGVLRR